MHQKNCSSVSQELISLFQFVWQLQIWTSPLSLLIHFSHFCYSLVLWKTSQKVPLRSEWSLFDSVHCNPNFLQVTQPWTFLWKQVFFHRSPVWKRGKYYWSDYTSDELVCFKFGISLNQAFALHHLKSLQEEIFGLKSVKKMQCWGGCNIEILNFRWIKNYL